MIYLTLDSDVWLNSLKDSGEVDNPIDKLEYWVENGNITVLLPQQIVTEWERNRSNKKDELIKDWTSFYNRAKKHLKAQIIEELKTPENLNSLVEEQLGRVENIFKNFAIIIDTKDEHRVEASKMAEEKKAPFRKNKNSIGDALIILAMYDYFSQNVVEECIFISNNKTDFSRDDLDDEVHPDIEQDFNKYRIKYFRDLKRFFYIYKTLLPDTSNHQQQKKLQSGAKKLTGIISNPQPLNNLPGVRESYIDDISHLDIILKTALPTRAQAEFALHLIDSDGAYLRYFFKNVSAPVWFNIIRSQGMLKPENNPEPIPVEKGFQIPFWPPLEYLEKLSLLIKNDENHDLIEPIIDVIKELSQNPKDNYRTWYFLIKVLGNLPNERIPLSILNFIPVWFRGDFRATLQSSDVCNILLPKFLPDEPTYDDINKAELILRHLFEVSFLDISSDEELEKAYSDVDMYYLQKAFRNRNLIEKIIKYCSDEIIIHIGKELKKLLQSNFFASGIEIIFDINDIELIAILKIKDDDLLISIKENNIPIIVINKFAIYNEENLQAKIQEKLFMHGLEVKLNEKNTNEYSRIFFLLNTDFKVSLWFKVDKLDKEHERGDIIEMYGLIFRNLLDEKAKQDPKNAINLLRMFSCHYSFKLPFYKRISIYVIGNNWEELKGLFWELVGNDDAENKLFSEIRVRDELYWLLNNVSKLLNSADIERLVIVINNGLLEDEKNNDENRVKYWKLGWYSALREIEPFKQEYRKLSDELNISNSHFERKNEISIRPGSVSPFSTSQILAMSIEELSNYIFEFKPKDKWVEPDIGGLASSVGKAIETEPIQFAEKIQLFQGFPYIYIYHLLNGHREAWKNGRSFNWKNLLEFCKGYISDKRFYTEGLSLENDSWSANSDWVVGSIAELLSEGMKSDSNAFDVEHLPIAKEILKILVDHLLPSADFEETNMDFPTYSLNSKGGKVLRALLDYSLRIGRTKFEAGVIIKWENDAKELFEGIISKGIIDGYILLGWYFPQFYFLDKDWITQRIITNYGLADKEWRAYMAGVSLCGPVYNQEIYQILYHHYLRGIKTNTELDGRSYEASLIHHFVAYYFWEFEDLSDTGLLKIFIESSDANALDNLVSILWQQEMYYSGLNEVEKPKLEIQIFELWKILSEKYSPPTGHEEENFRANLCNLLAFVPVLNETVTELIIDSCNYIDKHFNLLRLLERLNEIILTTASPKEAVGFLGRILSGLHHFDYLSEDDKELINKLVSFIYVNGEKEVANNFCNRLAKQGYDFLNDLYKEFNLHF